MVGKTNSVTQINNISHTNQPLAFFWGTQGSGSSDPPTSYVRTGCDTEYFSVSSGKFTCKKAFTGYIYAWGLSSRNSAGDSNTLTWTVYKNSTSVATGNGTGYSHSSGSGVSVTFAVNDVIYIRGAHSRGGTVRCSMGLVITR